MSQPIQNKTVDMQQICCPCCGAYHGVGEMPTYDDRGIMTWAVVTVGNVCACMAGGHHVLRCAMCGKCALHCDCEARLLAARIEV